MADTTNGVGSMRSTETRRRAAESLPKSNPIPRRRKTLADWLKRPGSHALVRTNQRVVTIKLSFDRGGHVFDVVEQVERAEIEAGLYDILETTIDEAIRQMEHAIELAR